MIFPSLCKWLKRRIPAGPLSASPTGRPNYYRLEFDDLESRTLLSAFITPDVALGTLAGFQNSTNSISGNSHSKSYGFTLATSGIVLANLTPDFRDLDLRLQKVTDVSTAQVPHDFLYEDLAESNNAGGILGNEAESISMPLASGKYLLTVDIFGFSLLPASYGLGLSIDYAGETTATARDLGAVAGSLGLDDFVTNFEQEFGSDQNDFYRFSTFTDSTIGATLLGLTDDADLFLIKESGEVVASSSHSGNNLESFNLGPQASGTYFVRVQMGPLRSDPVAGLFTNYHLVLTVTPVDGAGNSLTNPHIVPASGQAAQQLHDFVGTVDHDDFYRLFLSGPGPFVLSANLDGLSDDANLEILSATGALLAGSAHTGNAAEAIAITVNATGFYFVHVRQGSGNTVYTLTLQAVSTDAAGNTLGLAKDIRTLNGKRSFTEFVGAVDADDFYKFNFAVNGTLTASLSGLSKNADLWLIQDTNRSGALDAGDGIETSANGSTANETIGLSLNSGTYFVRVRSVAGAGDTNYTLTLTADYAGQDLRRARVVGPGTYSDFIGGADVNDFYRIPVAGDSLLTATQVGLPTSGNFQLIADFNGNLLIDDGEILDPDVGANGTSIQLGVFLARNSYYVRVSAVAGEANYNLILNVSPVSSSIAGLVFEDTNGDGAFSTGESTLSNVTLFLDGNNNGAPDTGEVTAVTINGVYRFPNLISGTYLVRQVTPPGFLSPPAVPSSGSYTVVVGPGQNVTAKNFADVRLASVSGSVFNDLNGNSVRDVNDTPLANWTIFVDTNNNLVLDSGEPHVVTNSLGNYALVNVRPGKVFQVLQTGFTQTLPLPTGAYTFGSGQNLTAQDFGLSRLIVDNVDAILTGSWQPSTNVQGFFGRDYVTDGNTGKGTKSARFVANIPVTGSYEVFARWTANSNRANNTPIDVIHRDGTATISVNQQQNGGTFVSLGIFFFAAGPNGIVVIRNGGTSKQVIADAVQFVRRPPVAPTDLTARLGSGSQIVLTWTDRSLSEAGFKIQRSLGPGFRHFEEFLVPAPNTTSFLDTTATPYRTYYYRVLAYGVSGASTFSNAARIWTTPLDAFFSIWGRRPPTAPRLPS